MFDILYKQKHSLFAVNSTNSYIPQSLLCSTWIDGCFEIFFKDIIKFNGLKGRDAVAQATDAVDAFSIIVS